MPTALDKQARNFRDSVQRTLNRTVTDGITLSIIETGGRVWIGHGIGRGHPTPKLIPITTRGAPDAFLELYYGCSWDDEEHYLTVVSSAIGLMAGEDQPIFRYDFERGKDTYTEAHLHVHASPEHYDSLPSVVAGRARRFDRIHLPVGGRRFRPCLEDVIEWMINEEITEPRNEQWQKALNESREEYYAHQLGAAVRRKPDLVVKVLREIGYVVDPPK